MEIKTIFETTILLLLVLIMSGGCSASECTNDGYAEYKPIFFNERARTDKEMYFIDESRIDAEHYENIKFVFEFHDVEYKVVDNKIMVECKVWKDKEFMTNMTKKADDKDWLATQIQFCLKYPKFCPSVKESTLENLKE